LTVDPIESSAYEFTSQVERFYAGLMQAAARMPQVPLLRLGDLDAHAEQEPSLGGKLLYAGELDAEARALAVAANIAGAASLAATADAAAAKQAVRDGVVDFMVTSLDEASRILKNEIRKRETVAVCAALAPEMLEGQMQERGVAPDLVRHTTSPPHRAAQVEALAVQPGQCIVAWSVAAAPALWLPKLDAIALNFVDAESSAIHRWLRQAPRYLGRLAQGLRLLRCTEKTAEMLRAKIQQRVESGEIQVPVEFFISAGGKRESFSFSQKTG
jgi:urocanate hydratase